MSSRECVKQCAECGAELAWGVGEHIFSSSDNIDDWDICQSCMIEHCCNTNCLMCENYLSKEQNPNNISYTKCRFFGTKQSYLNGDESDNLPDDSHEKCETHG